MRDDGAAMEPRHCGECGAPVPPGGCCRDNLHALLALEWEVPQGAGQRAHFHAVASYGIQHPESMGYTMTAYENLITAVRDSLEGRVTMEELRVRARRGAKAAGRVTRKEGDGVPVSLSIGWEIVVTDIIAGGVDGYATRVETWAHSVLRALDS